MSPRRIALIAITALLGLLMVSAVGLRAPSVSAGPDGQHLQSLDEDKVDWSAKDLAYWQSVLTDSQVKVCRQSGTERPFTGEHLTQKDPGVFHCSSCGQALFDMDSKFESGTGWPSFTEPVSRKALTLVRDNAYGMERTEVRCARCDAHLGHVFDDGPSPTFKRYCINSVCLLHRPEVAPATPTPKKVR